jgi:hypothetical protein
VEEACEIFQDIIFTIRLVENGKSNSNNTNHINIRYYFVADRVKLKEIVLSYLPTVDMLADIMTKPLLECVTSCWELKWVMIINE